jgi:hypothetical protein
MKNPGFNEFLANQMLKNVAPILKNLLQELKKPIKK